MTNLTAHVDRMVPIFHVTVIKPAIGIFCSSAPALRPLLTPLSSLLMEKAQRWRSTNSNGDRLSKNDVSVSHLGKIVLLTRQNDWGHGISNTLVNNSDGRPPEYYEDFITAPYGAEENENGHRLSSIRRPSVYVGFGEK